MRVELGFQQRIDRRVEVERKSRRAADAEAPVEVEAARAVHEQLDLRPNLAVRSCEAARRFYQRKKAARNSIVAIKAVAHKLARACYHMLKTGEPFCVHRCFA